MSGERAKRFPLALEDLKRAPRKSAARPNERHPSSPARPTLGASVAGSPARPAGL
ncbi:protein-L-isoaspartate O-methyltransferase, partial [Burkholderia gladioli]|nr:protein-L-isoaspartate O-methyltransferase [Burkholderia gladioli]